jgi:MFS family permease
LTAKKSRRRSIAIFFAFMLLHQVDRYLIGPLTTPIMETYGINEAQMGAVLTGAILVGAVFFPLWGYLFDRYARPKILALASLIWGSTTWLSAIAPTYGLFLASRASTGIDDAAYPGIYSMISDMYSPAKRGRILGTLQIAGPLAFVIGTVLGLGLSDTIGWRGVFYLTGGLGVLMAVVIYFFVKEVPRGSAEPLLGEVVGLAQYRINKDSLKRLVRKPTLLLIFLQVFVHLFPIQALILWSIRYFEVERGFSDSQIYTLTISLVFVGMAGFVVAGSLGDAMFKRTPRGRLLVGAAGVGLAAIGFASAFAVPTDNVVLFMLAWAMASFFYGFSQPTTTPSIQDITEPEVRSTAHAVIGIAEQSGSALAPLTVGLIAVRTSLSYGLLTVTGIGFAISSVLLFLASLVVKRDVEAFQETLRSRVGERSQNQEQRR